MLGLLHLVSISGVGSAGIRIGVDRLHLSLLLHRGFNLLGLRLGLSLLSGLRLLNLLPSRAPYLLALLVGRHVPQCQAILLHRCHAEFFASQLSRYTP